MTGGLDKLNLVSGENDNLVLEEAGNAVLEEVLSNVRIDGT